MVQKCVQQHPEVLMQGIIESYIGCLLHAIWDLVSGTDVFHIDLGIPICDPREQVFKLSLPEITRKV